MDTAPNIASQQVAPREDEFRDKIMRLLEEGFRELQEASDAAPLCSFGSLSTRSPIAGFLRGAIL